MKRDPLELAREVIRTEAQAVAALEGKLGPAFTQAVETIAACRGKLVVAGVGKSGLIGQKIAATLTSTGTPAVFLHPADALHGGEGEDKELAVLGDGDFFGELALLDEAPRSASAICRTDCSLIGFFRTDLFELIEQKTDLGIKIVLRLAEILAVRLRKADKELSKVRSELDSITSRCEESEPPSSEDHDGKDKTKSAGPRSKASKAR